MTGQTVPVTVVIPTCSRTAVLRRTLESLAKQSIQPVEVRIIDASPDDQTQSLCINESIHNLRSTLSWYPADVIGAAIQRNQGVRVCTQPVVGFMDDDIVLDPECFARLWAALHSQNRMGGVSAMIKNQSYQTPGLLSRFVFNLIADRSDRSYAGRVLGPAVNLLPEDREDLPAVVPVDWLNTCCTLYRSEALPDPPFPSWFTGYSLMEDLALSLTVGKSWKLANARTARIFHDSQPGSHKSDAEALAKMSLVNRHYVMTKIMGRTSLSDYLKLILFESFSVASQLRIPHGRALFVASALGKATGAWQLAGGSKDPTAEAWPRRHGREDA